MGGDILTLNAGSSSLKFSFWHCDTGMELYELFRGEIEKIGIAPHLTARKPHGDTGKRSSPRNSNPSIFGIIRSRMITSGCAVASASTAT